METREEAPAVRVAAERAPIVPTLEVAHEPGRDLVWCATLDLAWRELSALLGGPVALRDTAPDEPAAAIVRALNRSPVTGAAVDPGACLALAGTHTEEWVRRVERHLRERFGVRLDTRLLAGAPRPGLFVAYAYLAKALTFPTPLMREHGRLAFRCQPVESFGLWESVTTPAELHAARTAEVLVHHHRFLPTDLFVEEFGREPGDDEPTEEFVVELMTEDRGDRLVVARCVPGPTLAATVAWATQKLRDDVEADPGAFLAARERFEVPCIDFDMTRRYDELYGRAIANLGFEDQAFGEIVERVRFRLDEGGALLTSEARLGGLSLPPRAMSCDGPFLVMILRRGALTPTLALWIETADLLILPQAA
ncbi:hypothetical protein WME91_05745 [Sorangium sp. So ce269]